MEEIIKEGALRLLTSEASCDVILSCQGYRLMAHKVILSIASPLLQGLLQQHAEQPTVLIFPDTSGTTMSLILDYIYSGSVNVNSELLPDFVSAANDLELQIDVDSLSNWHKKCNDHKFKVQSDDEPKNEHSYLKNASDSKPPQPKTTKKAPRKVPNLIPISSFRSRKGLYNHVTPSPWCPRLAPPLADPRNDCLPPANRTISPKHPKTLIEQNDTNNNSQNFRKPPTQTYLREAPPPGIDGRKLKPNKQCSYRGPIVPMFAGDDGCKRRGNFPINLEKKSPLALLLKKVVPKVVDHSENSSSSDEVIPGNVEVVEEKFTNDGRTVTPPVASNGEEIGSQNANRLKPFVCEDCGKSFSQLRNFKYHRSVHEGTKEFAARCPECGKTFNDKGYLSSHMKIHRDRKEYGCPHCPKRFNQRVAYNMHLRIHTGVKPHECPTCGKTFSRKMLLKQHQRVHTGERPYSCPECGKCFADRSNMSLHARLHTGVKPYACNLCSKSFTKKHHLKTHMNFHTGLKPFSCQKCGLAFSQSSNMRTHYKKCVLKSPDAYEPENA